MLLNRAKTNDSAGRRTCVGKQRTYLDGHGSTHRKHAFKLLIFVVPSIMLYSSEISPTRCNNCVFILRNGFTLHVSIIRSTYAVYGHR